MTLRRMNRHIALALALCVSALGAVAQETQKLEDPTRGMTLVAPKDWYLADSAAMRAIMKVGLSTVAGTADKTLRPAIEASIERTSTVFSVHRHAPGTPKKPNASVMVMEEDIAAFPGIKDGCDYTEHLRAMLKNSPGLEFRSTDCKTRTFGGKVFGYFVVNRRQGATNHTQIYAATRIGSNALASIQTFPADESDEETTRILESMRFAK